MYILKETITQDGKIIKRSQDFDNEKDARFVFGRRIDWLLCSGESEDGRYVLDLYDSNNVSIKHSIVIV